MNIFENPFYILGVSPADNRRAIAAAADDKAFLLGDSKTVEEARSALLIPEKRLAAEMRWFPGTDNNKVSEITEFFKKIKAGQPVKMINMSGLSGLALVNFSVYIFKFRKFKAVKAMIDALVAIIRCFETLSINNLCSVLNKDRNASKFQLIEEPLLEDEFYNYRRDIVEALEAKLLSLSFDTYREVITELAHPPCLYKPSVKYIEYDVFDQRGRIITEEEFEAHDTWERRNSENSREFYENDKNVKFFRQSAIVNELIDNYELNVMPHLEKQKSIILNSTVDLYIYTHQFSSGFDLWKKLAQPLISIAISRGIYNQNLCTQAWEIIHAVRKNCERFLSDKQKSPQEKIEYVLNFTRLLKSNLCDVSPQIDGILVQDIKDLLKIRADIKAREREAIRNYIEQRQKSIEHSRTIKRAIFIGLLIIALIVLIFNSYSDGSTSRSNKVKSWTYSSTPSYSSSSSYTSRRSRRNELNTRLKNLKPQLDRTKRELDNLERELETMQSNINNYRTSYELFHDESDRLNHNAEINRYNDKVSSYNSLLEQHKRDIANYNSMVDEYNSLR